MQKILPGKIWCGKMKIQLEKSKKFNMQKFGKKTSPPLPQSLQKKKKKKVQKILPRKFGPKKVCRKKIRPKKFEPKNSTQIISPQKNQLGKIYSARK